MTDDERAIREVVDRWMSATKAGELDTVLDLMTDDVLFMTSGREPFGKSEFAAQSESLKGVNIEGRAVIEEIAITEPWAWIRNFIEITMTPDGGDRMRRSGYTLTILRKDGGRWRLFRDANLVS